MAGTWTSERFPQFEGEIRRLVERHRELEDEPLHLALSYQSERDQQGIFLFEVIGKRLGVNPDRDLFETTFEAVPGLPTGFDQPLHLVLTDPEEFEAALSQNWSLAEEVAGAVRAGDFKLLYADDVGHRLLRLVQAGAPQVEGVVGG